MRNRLTSKRRLHFAVHVINSTIYLIAPLEAPTAVEVIPKTTTSVNVLMTVAEVNTDVSFFEAAYQRQFCSVQSGATPRSCSIGSLSAGTSYRMYAMACMANFECSHRTFAEGFTLPHGMWYQSICHDILSLLIMDIILSF